MEEQWFDDELSGCRLGDGRLDRRLRQLVERMEVGFGESIPLACQDWASTKAAYRFFSNERVSEEDILRGHFDATHRPGHAVAYAAHVEDPGRVRRVVAELLVELFHEGAHDLGAAVAPPGPDPVQQRLGGRDPSGALSERARSSSYSVAVSSTSRPAMVTNRRS